MNYKMPSIGYFNKQVCDILGLWSSDKKDIVFNVPATESERRKVLNQAFHEFDGRSCSLNDLIDVTTKIHPKPKLVVKKNKTIQDYCNHYCKDDFSSLHEFLEFKEYIEIAIDEQFSQKEIATLAKKFYNSSMLFYREFIREHAVNPASHLGSYEFFVDKILRKIAVGLPVKESRIASFVQEDSGWPLRDFINHAVDSCDVSLHKLHQFHEVRLNDKISSDLDIWNSDLKGKPINSKSKQIVDRVSKKNKIKWSLLHSIISPLSVLLSDSKKALVENTYSAYLLHNILNHLRDINPSYNVGEIHNSTEWNYPDWKSSQTHLPLSDRVDLAFNGYNSSEIQIEALLDSYQELVVKYRDLEASLIVADDEVPSTILFSYSKDISRFDLTTFTNKKENIPDWVKEWSSARSSLSSNDSVSALQHYKSSLELSKYVAGPLFMYLYIEICAFCKTEYRKLKNKNEEKLFDRFYEPLGEGVTKYATLLGYTPEPDRDPVTLMPRSKSPNKERLILAKIDSFINFNAYL